ncbi:PepSY domain-containing protein [Corynebacterium pseudogenitalium]|uniref:PepSY domain-containing protein n=1 Tax=Corynebacterium pseudogenitalium TaxID=38303 RepID=UPI003BA0C6D6
MKRTLTVLAAAALLAGCSNGGTEAPAAKTVTETPTTVATSVASESAGEATNDAAYDAIEAARPFGTVIAIDRENNTNAFEVKVAAEDKIVELLVDGNHVMEKESEQDAEDVAKAGQATVAIEDAIKEALGQHDGILDSAELDEDNGALQWEISIDNPDGTDLAEVNVPAK